MKASSACGWACATPTYIVPPDRPSPLPVTSLLDRFAEELAECGDIAAASAAIRVPEGTGRDLFERICVRLGPQARA
jgi:hypothetical protein